MRPLLITSLLGASLLLSGCGSITGLQDAESSFACSVDMTPRCAALSAIHESLEKEEVIKGEPSDTVVITTEGKPIDRLAVVTPLMTPKRAPEEILRVWVAPYIDTEGDLHTEHVIFTTVRGARWAPETLDITPMKRESQKWISPLKGPHP